MHTFEESQYVIEFLLWMVQYKSNCVGPEGDICFFTKDTYMYFLGCNAQSVLYKNGMKNKVNLRISSKFGVNLLFAKTVGIIE